MKVIIGKVEGKTNRKGQKQNKTYNVIPSERNWFKSECGMNIWNVNGDWTLIGMMKGMGRMTYTKEFITEQ